MEKAYIRVFIVLGMLLYLFACRSDKLPYTNCTYRCDRKLYYCYYQVEKENRKKVIARVEGRLGCEKREKACRLSCETEKE